MATTDGAGAFSLVDNGEAYYYALFPGRFLRAFPRGNALSRSVALDVSLGVDVGVGVGCCVPRIVWGQEGAGIPSNSESSGENITDVISSRRLDTVHCYQVSRVAVNPGNANQNGSVWFSVEDLSEESHNSFRADVYWLRGDIKYNLFPIFCSREVERLLLT